MQCDSAARPARVDGFIKVSEVGLWVEGQCVCKSLAGKVNGLFTDFFPQLL